MTFALDTDIFSHLVKGHARVTSRYAEVIAANEHTVAVPAVVRVEVLRGRFNAITTAADGTAVLALYDLLRRTETSLEPFGILPVTRAAADRFDVLLKNKKLKNAGRPDLLIACIALAHGATLVTRNTKDFANIPGLKTENWAD